MTLPAVVDLAGKCDFVVKAEENSPITYSNENAEPYVRPVGESIGADHCLLRCTYSRSVG